MARFALALALGLLFIGCDSANDTLTDADGAVLDGVAVRAGPASATTPRASPARTPAPTAAIAWT